MNTQSTLKTLLVSFALTSCNTSAKPRDAKSICAQSQWKLPRAIVGEIAYGSSFAEVKNFLKTKYGSLGDIKTRKEGEGVVFREGSHDSLHIITFTGDQNKVTRIGMFYSERFINSLGGSAKALSLIVQKLSQEYDERPELVFQVRHNVFSTRWQKSGGVILEVIQDISTREDSLYVRYTCVELEEQQIQQQAENLKIGF